MGNEQSHTRQLTPQQREALRQKRREARASATYHEFLRDLKQRGFTSEGAAEQAASSVLSALELRLTSDQSWKLESQLPLKLRQLLTRSELHEDLLPRAIHRAEFLNLVRQGIGGDDEQVLHAVRAVFETIASHITAGEVLKLIHQLPADLRELWPAWARAGEEYRATVLQALPGTSADVRESMLQVVEGFLELSLRAQLAALRALTPWVLARLTEQERQDFARALGQDVADFEQALNGGAEQTTFAS